MFSNPRRIGVAALALSLALAAAACSDDDETSTADDDSSETTLAPGDGTVTPAACDAFVAFGGAMMGDPSALGSAGTDLAGALPDSLRESGDVVTEALGSDDPEAAFSPEVAAALSTIGDAMYEDCEAETRLDVDGVDFGFEGLPDELAAGRTAIRFTNKTNAEEPHELQLMMKAPGVTLSAEELLELPEEEAMEKVMPVGGVFAETANASSAGLFDLEPGEYVAICFIPVGGAEEGPPHAMQGMIAEFTVA